jgi:hypothetical protein
MSPEAQRIAIAGACGWRYAGMGIWATPRGREYHGTAERVLPDYLNDLNTMHEMRRVLDNGALWGGYLNRLWDVVCPQFQQMSGLDAAIGLLLVHATAAQRAEAFLKTLNKWEDDK